METVRRQALATFSRRNGGLSFEDNLRVLMTAMSKLSKEEVGLDSRLMREARVAPVTYVNIHEHEDVTISMFVLRNRSQLPLHDHPFMFGLIKVVSGIVEIRNFSFVEDPLENYQRTEVLVKKEPIKIVGENDPPVLLTPSKGNIHEITCKNMGGAAFVDVLAPPYGSFVPSLGPRPCFYYFQTDDQPTNEQQPSDQTDNMFVKFVKSQDHPEFFTDVAPYLGH